MSDPQVSNPMGYAKQPLIGNVQISNEGTTARFTLPGLSPEYIDRSGNLALWKASKLFETARVTAVRHPGFLFQKALPGPNKSAFIVLANMELDRSLYRKVRKHSWMWPVDLTTSLVGFGTSSIDCISVMEDPVNSARLGVLKFKYVAVNMETRKSMVIPKELKQPYVKYYRPELAVSGYRPEARPADAHHLTVTVKPNDIDVNGHLNNCMYFRFCMDTAANTSFDDAFRSFHGDIAYYNAQRLSAVFQSECSLGESLQVFCWEDSSIDLLLHFQILKENNRPSFSCKIKFYPPKQSKL